MRRRWWVVGGGGAGCGCLGLGGVAAVALALGGGAVALYVASSYWDQALRAALAQATGGEVDFDRVRLSWRGLVVRGVVVTASDGRPCLTADRVEVGIRDLSLLETSDWTLSSLSVSGVRATPRRTASGWALPDRTLSWLHLSGEGALPSLHAPVVTVRDARVDTTTPDGTVVSAGVGEASLSAVEVVVGADGATLAFGPLSASDLSFGVGTAISGTAASAKGQGSGGTWSWTSAPALGDLVVKDVAATVPGGRLTVGAAHLAGARWDEGIRPADADVTDLALVADGQRVALDRVSASGLGRVAFGTPLAIASVTGGTLSTDVRDLAAVGAVLRGLAALPDARRWPVTVTRASLDAVARTGTPVKATGVTATGAGWDGRAIVADEVAAEALAAGALSLRSLSAPSVRWDPAGPLALDTATGQGLSVTLDPHAPWLGLPAGVFVAVPAGVSVTTLTLPDAAVTVAASGRSVEGTFAALAFAGVEVDGAGVRARSLTATGGAGDASAPSGTVRWSVARAVADDVLLAERTTVRGGVVEGATVGGKGDRVAQVDRIVLGADGVATVAGGTAWTALVAPHALDVPPLVAEHVPKGLGGVAKGTPPWWGVDLQGLPWTLQRVEGAGTVFLQDRVVGDRRFEVKVTSFSAGPRADTVPLEAHGEVAGGRFDATGVARGDGTARVRIDAKSIDARELESYGTRLMEVSGLGIGPGRIAADVNLQLTPTTLTISGDLMLRNLTLVVRDKKKVGAALLAITRGGRFEVPEQNVPIEATCALAEPACSPLDQIAKVVTQTLVDRVSKGVSGGAGVGEGVKDAVNDVLGGGKAGKRGKGR